MMNLRAWHWLSAAFIFMLILGASSAPDAWGQSEGLNLVLLIDSSGSTADTDPQEFRIQAADFLLEYVQSVGEAQGVTYRFAAANFNTATLDEIPWTDLQGDAGRDQLVARSDGGTDFGPALQYARDLREETDASKPMAIILFTDGKPDPADDLESYFGDLQPTVEALQASGAHIFVVAVGDEAAVADDNWKELLQPEHYERVTDMRDLSGIYRRWLADLLNLTKDEQGTRFLTADETTTVRVESYLEQLVISVFPESQQTEVEVLDVAGDPVDPARQGGTVYVRNAPWPPGIWDVNVTGDGAQVWVDRRYATLRLRAPEAKAPQALGTSIAVEGALIRSGEIIADDDLTMTVDALAPNGKRTSYPLTRKPGRYEGTLTNLSIEGVYSLTLSAEWDNQSVGARQTTPVTVSLHPVPDIIDYDVQGDLTTSQLITVTANISYAERVGPETDLFARLVLADGETKETPALRDDGQGPDAQADDGVFTAQVPLPNAAGRYSLACVIQGLSCDGVRLDAVSDITRLEVRSPAPVVTETPTVTPTPKLTPIPTLPDGFDVPDTGRRYHWLIIGLVVAGSASGYLIQKLWRQRKTEKAKRVRIAPKIWALWRQRNLLEIEVDKQRQRAESAEQECEVYNNKLDRKNEIIDLLTRQGSTDKLDEKIELGEKILGLVSKKLKEQKQEAYQQACQVFANTLIPLRKELKRLQDNLETATPDEEEDIRSEKKRYEQEYYNFILKQANSDDYPIVQALAHNLSRDNGSLRPPAEVIKDLYRVLSSSGSQNSLLLRAITEEKNTPIASLCTLLYRPQFMFEPSYRDIAKSIETHLGEDGQGLKATYELIGLLKQYPLDGRWESDWDKAINCVDETGPQPLSQVLNTTREYFKIKSGKPDSGKPDSKWYRDMAAQLAEGKHILRKDLVSTGLPELNLFWTALDKWHSYAEQLIIYEEITPESLKEHVKLEVRPSLDLKRAERTSPYYYREVYEGGIWIIEAPVIIYNRQDTHIHEPIELTLKVARGNARCDPKTERIVELSPLEAVCKSFQVQAAHSANLAFCILGKELDYLEVAPEPKSEAQKAEDNSLLGESQKTAERIIEEIQKEFIEFTSSKKNIHFLRGMPGAGRTSSLRYIREYFAEDSNVIVVALNLLQFTEDTNDIALRRRVWYWLLENVQQQVGSQVKIPEEENLDSSKLLYLLEDMLDGRKLLLTIDNTEQLPESKESLLMLSFIAEKQLGAVVTALDRVTQPWEEWLRESLGFNEDKNIGQNSRGKEDKELRLLDKQMTKELVRQRVQGRLTSLAHKGVWIHSGGHPGFITLLCERLPTQRQVLGLDDVEEVMCKIDEEETVQSWYLRFSQEERCILSILVRGNFVQAETGLLKGLQRIETEESEITWSGIGRLQRALHKKYPDIAPWKIDQLEKLLEGFIVRQVIEVFEPQGQYGTLRWRMGWVYVMAPQISVYKKLRS